MGKRNLRYISNFAVAEANMLLTRTADIISTRTAKFVCGDLFSLKFIDFLLIFVSPDKAELTNDDKGNIR